MKRIELRIKENVYKETPNPTPQNPEGVKRKLIKRGVITKVKPYLDDIRLVGTVVNDKGNVDKNYCKIFVRDVGFIIVNHSYEDIDKQLDNKTDKTVGFKIQ